MTAPTEPETLHLFNLCDCDYVVARDLDDAWEIYTTHCGEKREDYADDPSASYPIPDGKVFEIYTDGAGEVCEPSDDGAKLESDTAAGWAKRLGRGYAFGTEMGPLHELFAEACGLVERGIASGEIVVAGEARR